jgi:hypothetical protein
MKIIAFITNYKFIYVVLGLKFGQTFQMKINRKSFRLNRSFVKSIPDHGFWLKPSFNINFGPNVFNYICCPIRRMSIKVWKSISVNCDQNSLKSPKLRPIYSGENIYIFITFEDIRNQWSKFSLYFCTV